MLGSVLVPEVTVDGVVYCLGMLVSTDPHSGS